MMSYTVKQIDVCRGIKKKIISFMRVTESLSNQRHSGKVYEPESGQTFLQLQLMIS